MTGNNPNLDLVNINAHTKFGQILSILNILSGNGILNEILASVKGHNSVTIVWKMMCNNLDLVNINAYTKFGKILSICSQDIEQKQIMTYGMMETRNDGWKDGRNDGQPKSSIAPLFQSGAI